MKGPTKLQSFVLLATIVVLSLCSCSTKSRESEKGQGESKAENNTVAERVAEFKNVDPRVKSQVAGLLTGYFALNQALIEDNAESATVAATELLETTKKFEVSKLTGAQMDFYFVHSSKLQSGLQDIKVSDGIEKARTGLATVSEAMYSLVKAFHPNESTLYYQYCPMARNNQGANWLSATEELANPYMGQMMLNCGKTQEKLEGGK